MSASPMIVLPELVPGMEEALVARWCVKPGDVVAVGDILAEIETDKATIDLAATNAGVIEELCIPEGTAGVRVNALLARMKAPELEPAARVSASPIARRIARDGSVDLRALAGSGPGGRIVKRDVESAAAYSAAPGATRAPASDTGDRAAEEALEAFHALGIAPGSYDLVPLDAMRKSIAARMTNAFRDIPHFPLTVNLHVDALLALRAELNAGAATRQHRISVNDMLIKAVALALARVPAANASYTPAGIARHRHADVAFAVALEDALITPIVRAAEGKSLAAIAIETRELADLARERRLQPAQYRGGSFTLSNLGMFGIHAFASILNPPHGCILSVGAIEPRVVVLRDGIATASCVTVTLTCDHRVVDGAVGARWLAALRDIVETPSALLA